MPDQPRSVSRFEANLLTILRSAFGAVPPSEGLRAIHEKLPRPVCLSANALHLIKDTLSKGCILFLVRSGGWRVETFLQDGKPVSGRCWNRHAPQDIAFSFGPMLIDFLMWLTSERPSQPVEPWDQHGEWTPGESIVMTRLLDLARGDAPVAQALRGKSPFVNNALARLAQPSDWAAADLPVVPDFGRWFQPDGAAVLESLQPWLAAQWIRSERSKGQITDWKQMLYVGQAEEAVLSAYLAAADRAGRRDLSRFLLTVGSSLYGPTEAIVQPGLAGPGVSAPVRLAERLEARRAALALPRQFATLNDWTQTARRVGYFDEEYAAAQLWKDDWERAEGDRLSARARELVNSVELLPTR